MKISSPKPRLCWTRRDLVEATGLSYRSIQNLEARGLLRRCLVGINVVVYSAASVRGLFAEQAAPSELPRSLSPDAANKP